MRTISATDRRLGRHVGALLCVAALALLAARALVWSALGLELLAAAFWWWARAASDADRQLARWGWLRRPPGALWLATAIVAAVPAGMHGAGLWR
ncbi:MAG TPA: hypothetical protein VFK69_11550, partial [Candidatus Eisenbacteria bacterium]|nr:hypothetical protein [Candidatus Eisenbacteria bacterium]